MQLALQPAFCLFRFQRVGSLAIEALERARSFATGRQRKDQKGPATGANRSFGLAHTDIQNRKRLVVCSVPDRI
jgi:hypothetical protein